MFRLKGDAEHQFRHSFTTLHHVHLVAPIALIYVHHAPQVFRLKGDAEHQFRNIQRSEWQPLFEFFQAKRIKIENLAAAKQGPAGGNAGVDLAEAYGAAPPV